MFTGLIEETGSVRSLSREGSGYLLSVSALEVMDNLCTGDSVAIDGACQTVVSFDRNSFSVFVSEVTASLTTLASFKAGAVVNLERAMKADGRFGGHIVQGHVDGTGSVLSVVKDSRGMRFRISAAPELMRYVIAKGSICVNGVSLTVVEASGDFFELYLIPETLDRTNLPSLKSGDRVNIETDILARYIEKLLGKDASARDGSLMKTLGENGFV